MKPHRGASDAAEYVSPFTYIIGENPLLDMIELARHIVAVAVDAVDHKFQDCVHQRRGARDLAAAPQRLACGVNGVERVVAASDEEVLGHGEMEKANFVGDPVEAESKIGKDAKQASLTRIELLVVVGGDEQLARSGGKIG